MTPRPTPEGFWFLDGHITIHLPQAANATGISVVEHLLPPGFGPPFRVHRHEDETFFLLDGHFRFKLGNTLREACAGELVHLPKSIPHGFRVLSPSGGRCLTITGDGFEAMLRQASRPAPGTTLPPPARPTPEMQAALARYCAHNGIDLLGPPIG